MDLLYKYEIYLSNYAKSTQKNYLESTKLFLNYLKAQKGKLNNIIIYNIGKYDIYNYIAYLDGKSKGTIKNRLQGIKNFYNFLQCDLRQELFEDIKVFDTQKKLPKILSWHEIDLLTNYYKDKRNNLIIFLLLQTGIRLSEIANIRIEDIDFKDQYIMVLAKGGKQRQVYISNKSKEMILDYIGNKQSGSLFGISKREIQYIVKQAMRNLGIKGSTHTLRHTIATKMYEQTNDILLVKEFLGHKSIVSTQIYTHISNKLVKEAVDSNPLAHFRTGGERR